MSGWALKTNLYNSNYNSEERIGAEYFKNKMIIFFSLQANPLLHFTIYLCVHDGKPKLSKVNSLKKGN